MDRQVAQSRKPGRRHVGVVPVLGRPRRLGQPRLVLGGRRRFQGLELGRTDPRILCRPKPRVWGDLGVAPWRRCPRRGKEGGWR